MGWLKIKGLEYLETRAQFFYKKKKKFLLCASDDTFLEVKRKDKHKDFSPMLHHDESPGKPQYIIWQLPISRGSPPPPILPLSPFSRKDFQTPHPNHINFEKDKL